MKFGEYRVSDAKRRARGPAVAVDRRPALALSPLLPVVAAESDKDPGDDLRHRARPRCASWRSASANRWSSTCRATSRMCWSPIRRSPMPSFVPRSAPISISGAVGQTNVVFFDGDGQQIASYDIAIRRDLNGVAGRAAAGAAGIQIEGVGDSVLLTGSDLRVRSKPSRPVRSPARLVGGSGEGRQLDRRSAAATR